MASGSSPVRANNSVSKAGFDFASDDVLCSYEDYGDQEVSNGSHSDPAIGANSIKDFHKTKLSRSVLPTNNVYTQPEDSLNQEMIITIERTMKKYADNLMRFLEGISSRLSQLELYCYNLDKSIVEMRSDLGRDHGEADEKLKSLDKHLQEVHRSVRLLRDKQELAETQKELAKLQLAQKESLRSQQEEKVAAPVSVPRKTGDIPEMHNLQLALALPNQVAPQTSIPARAADQQQSVTSALPSQMSSHNMNHQSPYYLPATQLPNPAPQHQAPQGPYLTAHSQYRAPQQAQNPSQGQVNQSPQLQHVPQYQQPWSQPITQPSVQPTQPQPMQSQGQIRAPPSPLYAAYMPGQSTNPPQEALTSSMPMQVPLSGLPHQGVGRPEAMPYGYGGSSGSLQPQPPPEHIKGSDGYPSPVTHAPILSGGSYVMYDSEGGRSHHSPQPTHFSHGVYHPTNSPLNPHPQPPTSAGLVVRGPSPPQFVRNQPYNELIDKLVSMGYRGDHVASVIQRLEESRQPVDFNALLDKLNGHSSGGSQRSW